MTGLGNTIQGCLQTRSRGAIWEAVQQGSACCVSGGYCKVATASPDSPKGGAVAGALSSRWLAARSVLSTLQLNEAVNCSKDALCRPALTSQCTLQALQPKLEAMEASWYRLHSISSADTPEEVISYWEGESSQCRAHSCWAMQAASYACLKGSMCTSRGSPEQQVYGNAPPAAALQSATLLQVCTAAPYNVCLLPCRPAR